MIVSFIHNKKKKQVKIDELESIFSIKNKINYIFFSESKKIEDIEYKVPSDKYLELLYGKDWKTPKRKFKPQHIDRNE